MTGKFREVWRSLHTTAGVHHTVTLASLVEKEGKLAEERPASPPSSKTACASA